MKFINITLIAGLLATSTGYGFDQAHTAFDTLLQKHVKGSRVDYQSFQSDRSALQGYLGSLSKVSRSEFKAWQQPDQLAFLINLYNAATIELILDNYPVKTIKRIGGLRSPWKLNVVSVFGDTTTLDAVEHEMLRKWYSEPRIHFAINCASVGCPNLANRAFTGKQLEDQLDKATKAFLSDTSKNKINRGKLVVSPIFDWFKEDFVKASGSVPNFVAPYFDAVTRDAIKSGKMPVTFGDYDWNLNDQKR